MTVNASAPAGAAFPERTVYPILIAISVSHCLNDTLQSLISAIYPMLRDTYALSYAQIGLVTLAFQMTASLLQPLIGLYTDYYPKPWSLPTGMGVSLIGLLLMAFATRYEVILLAAALVGVGSSVFHPESSRVARMASGGRPGLAQSTFQVGGNLGSSLGPLLAAFIVLPLGQNSLALFSLLALAAILILTRVSRWYAGFRRNAAARAAPAPTSTLPRPVVVRSIVVLMLLVFSKFVYLSSMTSYFTFFLIHKFSLSNQDAQLCLFVFLIAVTAGTFFGGPLGDRIGRKFVIWGSILGVLPFTLALPYVGLTATLVLAAVVGFILSSAFSAIVVYAQELVPGKTGMIAGLFFGLAFGLGGLGAALLGKFADATSLDAVFAACAWLPAIGILTIFLPNIESARRKADG